MSRPESTSSLHRVESYQYPAEHVGHLGVHHLQALERFKQICQKKGYYTPAASGNDASHDDETLLRFLRARKWVPEEAFAQFRDTENWRKENQLDRLYDTIDVEDYDVARKLYPQWTGRRDKRGIPVYVFEVGHLNSKAVGAHEQSTSKPGAVPAKVPAKMMRLFALYENLCGFVLPLCSSLPDRLYPETPVSQSNNIVDISGVGLKQFWNLKSHMQDASQLATAYYPETLDRIFIIGAPSFFPTVWGWIKKWFDPITVSKIFILSKADMTRTLEEFIDPEHIPKKYGGKLDYSFGQLPNIDPAISEKLRWQNPNKQNGLNTLPTGPIRWKRESGTLVATAVGSLGGKQRNTTVFTLDPRPQEKQATLAPSTPAKLELHRTRSGVHTHPPSPPLEDMIQEPAQDSTPSPPPPPPPYESRAPDFSGGASTTLSYRPTNDAATSGFHEGTPSQHIEPRMPTHETTGIREGPPAANFTERDPIPARPDDYEEAYATPFEQQSSAFAPTDVRQGTSATRYEQQNPTHAAGEVAEATPNMRSTGDGDKHGVVEPSTVGQAPKEHPVPEPEEPAPSYIEQAKGVAAGAYATAAVAAGGVLKAVGLGGQGEQVEESAHEEEKVVEDPAVDQAAEKNVEEFLRAKYATSSRSSNQSKT